MKLGPRISDQTASWLESNFASRNAGAQFILDSWPALYRQTLLRDLAGKFTDPELSLILDVFNGHFLTPQFAGQSLMPSVKDSMALDGTGAKWGIESEEGFIDKLKGLSRWESACLEVWARAFWESGAREREGGLEDWVKQLV